MDAKDKTHSSGSRHLPAFFYYIFLGLTILTISGFPKARLFTLKGTQADMVGYKLGYVPPSSFRPTDSQMDIKTETIWLPGTEHGRD